MLGPAAGGVACCPQSSGSKAPLVTAFGPFSSEQNSAARIQGDEQLEVVW